MSDYGYQIILVCIYKDILLKAMQPFYFLNINTAIH